jgi:hypothetical protein
MSIVQATEQDLAAIKQLDRGGLPVDYSTLVSQRRALGNTPAARYARLMDATDSVLKSRDPRDVAAVAKENETLLISKNVQPGSVHNISTLSNISVQYANEEYIGDQLMPIVTVAKPDGIFFRYDRRDRMSYPDDAIGPRGNATEIDEGRDTDTYSCKTYALQNYVDAMTLAAEDAPLNELVDLTDALNEGIAFNREIRQAAILTTGSNYGGNTVALSGADRWDSVSGGDPIKAIQNARAAVRMGRGATSLYAFCDLEVYNTLSRHPAILDLYKYGGSTPGLATPDMIARFFGMERLLVGQAWKETAKEGQASSEARIWGHVFGIVRVAARPGIRTAAFGYTLRWQNVVNLQWFDQTRGMKGGWFSKVGVADAYKVIAPITGYLITTPIS